MIKRYTHNALTILLSLWITLGTAHGERSASKSKSIESPEIRALALGLENGLKDLEILDAKLQSVGRLSLRQFAFSKAFTCPIVEGKLLFGVPDGTDGDGDPKFKLLASYDWQEADQQVCLLFLPKSLMLNDAQSTADYTIQPLDMSSDSFQSGHTQILNFTPLKTKVVAGEHNTIVAPWDRSECSIIKETTGVNMAQLEVSYIKDSAEHNIFQTRFRYVDTVRFITLIYTDTKAEKVKVRIVKDFGNLFK